MTNKFNHYNQQPKEVNGNLKQEAPKPIRNLKAFILSYFNSKSGQASLERKPQRIKDDKGQFKVIFKSSYMAEKLHEAALKA